MPLNNVSLMGPNPAQPLDIQTAQSQLQLQQQIAQALLASGMSPTSMLDTGLVKTANWGDALGKIAEVYGGRKALDTIGGQQQGLAQEYNTRLATDMENVLAAPDFRTALHNASTSTIPEVRQLGLSLWQARMKAAEAMMPKPENYASGARNLTTESMSEATEPGFMGLSQWNPAKLVNIPTVEQGPGGALVTLPKKVGAQAVPAGVAQPPVTPVSTPDTGGGLGGLPTQRTPSGVTEVVPGSEKTPAAAQAKEALDRVQGNFDPLNRAKAEIPKLLQVVNLAGRAMTGGFSNLRQDLVQTGLQLGLITDQEGRLSSTQSLVALLLPRVAQELKPISPRAAQQIIDMVKTSQGAGAEADPRHIVDIAGNAIATIMTDINRHNNVDIPAGNKTWAGQGKNALDQWRVDFPAVTLPADSPIKIIRQGDTFVNQGLVTPRSFKNAADLPIKTINGVTYRKIGENPDGTGRWEVATPQTLQVE